MNIKKQLLVYISIICGLSLHAQEKMQVVAKTVKQEFRNPVHVVIKGEKAEINVQSWNQNYVYVEIQLVARNVSAKQARKDVESNIYGISSTHGIVKVQNSFTADSVVDIQSNMSAIYSIKVPHGQTINILNVYGSTTIENCLSDRIIAKSSFGKLFVQNSTVKIIEESYYSDTRIENSTVDYNASTDKGNISLTNTSGACEIRSKYGKIDIIEGKSIDKLIIESKRTEINVQISDFRHSNISLQVVDGTMEVPSQISTLIKKEGNKHILNYNKGNRLIAISTSYSKLNLNYKKTN